MGYRFTESFFRLKKIPFPFELFGVAVGLGLASWLVAVVRVFDRRK